MAEVQGRNEEQRNENITRHRLEGVPHNLARVLGNRETYATVSETIPDGDQRVTNLEFVQTCSVPDLCLLRVLK
jgi:hypothetical protein